MGDREQFRDALLVPLLRSFKYNWGTNEEKSAMIYLKSVFAGLSGSILAIVMFAIVAGILYRKTPGFVGINVVGLLPLSVALVGFAVGFYLMFRTPN
jgi:hypothetical protein